jgi:hypothetical protein
MGDEMKRLIAALIVIAAAGVAAAEAPSNAPVTRVSAPWKIVGVGLGMTPAEVAAALAQDGFKVSSRFTGRSWQGEVANQVSNLRSVRIPEGARVTTREDYRAGQEQVQVTYTAGRAGPYVSRVDYAIDFEAIEADRFESAVLEKYGEPSLRWNFEMLYCLPEERQCGRTGGLVHNQLPNLTVYVASVMKRVLVLQQGERADKAYWAAVRSEAERLYPKKNKTSF